MKFPKSLKEGEKSERLVMEMVEQKGLKPIKIVGAFKPYDFVIAETLQTFEVKRDWKSKETGNVVVEVQMPPGNDSGLITTRADYWVFHLPDCFLFIRPNEIKSVIFRERLRSCVFIGEGDDVPKLAYLVKRELLEARADKIKRWIGYEAQEET
jgi:hypothetical protein